MPRMAATLMIGMNEISLMTTHPIRSAGPIEAEGLR